MLQKLEHTHTPAQEGLSYKPRTELSPGETVIFQYLLTKGEEGADRFELAELFQGDYTMGPRIVENVVAMAGHIAKHYPENIPQEFQGCTIGHIEGGGGKYGIFPLDNKVK